MTHATFRAATAAALLCAAVLPHSAIAQPHTAVSCDSPQTTIEINECAAREYKAQDAALNAAYRALTRSLQSSGAGDTTDYAAVKAHLVAAQKAWVLFRDADCLALRTLHEDGTIRTVMQLSCLSQHTEQRTKELKAWRQP